MNSTAAKASPGLVLGAATSSFEGNAFVTHSELDAALVALRGDTHAFSNPTPFPAQIGGNGNPFVPYAGANAVPQSLSNTTITTPIVSNPTITGGSISGASVSGYLPLSGGTLTGDLTGTDLTLSGNLAATNATTSSLIVTGNLTVSGTQSISGAISVPYLTATSTTQPSTFAGNVGIGTTTPNWLLQVAGTRPFSVLTDTSAGTDAKHWFETSQGGNFYIGTSSDALNATTTYLTIANGGNVGIGITSPSTLLYLKTVAPTLTVDDSRNQSWNIGDQVAALDFGSDDQSSGGFTGKVRSRIAVLEEDTFGASQSLGFYTTRITDGVLREYMELRPWGDLVLSRSLHESFGNTNNGPTYLTIMGSGGAGNGNLQLSSSNVSSSNGISLGNVEWHNFAVGTGTVASRSAYINVSLSGATGTNIGSFMAFGTESDGTGASGAGTERMRIDSQGRVGIGTSNPANQLDIGLSSDATAKTTDFGTLNVANSATSTTSSVIKTGVRISSTGSWTGTGSSNIGLYVTGVSGGTNNYDAIFNGSGNVGIGTSSPDTLLSVGSATPSGNVAHFENSTGSCYINPTTTSLSCSSDERLKKNITSLEASSTLAELLALNPVLYNWNSEASGTPEHTGFIAQQVQPVLPDLVSQGPDGYLTMNYAGLTPYLVKALQEFATITGAFEQNLIAWLASAENGIQDLFAHNVYATNVTADTGTFRKVATGELCATKSDGTAVCVTGDQLAALLGQSAGANTPISVSSSGGGDLTNSGNPPHGNSSSDPTPPVIQINGDNPAIIHVGDSYQDLGATITGPTDTDKNLGLKFFLNGTLVSDIMIDTTQVASDTIDYVATDQNGLTATSTRTVIIEATAPSPAPDYTASTTIPAIRGAGATVSSSASETVASSTAQ